MIQPTLINLHPNEYSQEFHYYPFAVKLDRWVGSCNTPNNLSNNVRVPNKTGHLNLTVFTLITGINKSKTLTKVISCECECKFDGRKCNSNQRWNNDKCLCECKKHRICEKDYIWNPARRSCKNGEYLASIIGNSVITSDEVIEADAEAKSNEETKTIPKNVIRKTKNFYIFLGFLLITIALLIAVSIYCYPMKYKAKQKHLLPFYITNNEVKEVLY